MTGGEQEHTLSLKVACLCPYEDRGASPILTVFVNFQILSTIIHRLCTINSWLITQWSYQQLVDKSKSSSTIHSCHSDDELIVDKVVLINKDPRVLSTERIGEGKSFSDGNDATCRAPLKQPRRKRYPTQPIGFAQHWTARECGARITSCSSQRFSRSHQTHAEVLEIPTAAGLPCLVPPDLSSACYILS